MRLLDRNKQTISYKLFVSKTETTDTSGNKTGEYTLTYSDFKTLKGVLRTPAIGTEINEAFGIVVPYQRILVVDDMNCDLAIDSKVWVNASTNDANDYVVIKIEKSYNHISYGLKEVDA